MPTRQWTIALVSLLVVSRVSYAEPPALKKPAGPIAGALVIAGGGSLPDAVRDRFVELAGGKDARLVVIPTASASADGPDAAQSLEPWKKKGVASAVLLHTRSRAQAEDPAFIKPLKEAIRTARTTQEMFEALERGIELAAARESEPLAA